MGREERSYTALCAEYDRLQTAVIELVRQIPTCAKCRESGADVLATRVSGLYSDKDGRALPVCLEHAHDEDTRMLHPASLERVTQLLGPAARAAGGAR